MLVVESARCLLLLLRMLLRRLPSPLALPSSSSLSEELHVVVVAVSGWRRRGSVDSDLDSSVERDAAANMYTGGSCADGALEGLGGGGEPADSSVSTNVTLFRETRPGRGEQLADMERIDLFRDGKTSESPLVGDIDAAAALLKRPSSRPGGPPDGL